MTTVSDTRPIENLIAEYAEMIDTADLAGVGRLFAEGAFIGTDGTRYEGSEAVERMLHDRTIVHGDGTLRTHHVTTNIRIEVDEQAGTATGRAYLTLFQEADGLPLQPIAAGRYYDRYKFQDGTWRFAERRINVHLVGNTSYHMS
ncbi:nuclear transport factor 2 family protein [Streptomyces sp. E5N91]|uniref:nuclear transport factor 2 family protein n=1 Tax=Streptomyces sp. E5N91 TaxID=1851996 RepID=UPI000EF5E6F6|nr:nuclear transport factor 2 family protein [Streptomyces sp. E5N91]